MASVPMLLLTHTLAVKSAARREMNGSADIVPVSQLTYREAWSCGYKLYRTSNLKAWPGSNPVKDERHFTFTNLTVTMST